MNWKKLETKTPIDSPFVKVEIKQMRRDDNQTVHDYFHFKFPDFCNVVPITAAGEIVMVRQFRMGIEQLTLEVPGGVVDPNDNDPAATAIRELSEETGYGLNGQGHLQSLGWSYPNPAIQDNRCHFFVVGPVEQTGKIHNDETEFTEVELVPAASIEDRIRRGEILHALALNAFQFLRLHYDQPSIARAVEAHLAGR